MSSKESLIKQALSAVGRLSARERVLVVVTALVVVLFAFVGGTLFVQSKLDKAQRRLNERKMQLSQILSLEGQFREAEQERTRIADQMARSDVKLYTLLPKVASELGLTLNDLNERRVPVKDTGIDEVSVDVNLRQMSIDKLDGFLEKVESSSDKGSVKVLKVKVKTRFDNPELLDVALTVATYKPTSSN
jgi:hypothetical protein